MMKILETIQIGNDEQCTNMAEETCNYLGIDIKLFETMAEHAALDDWTMATTCYGKTDEKSPRTATNHHGKETRTGRQRKISQKP